MAELFEIYKKIDFSFTLNYKPFADTGIYCYILNEKKFNKRYLFLYHKELYKGYTFTSKELLIHNINLSKELYFYKNRNNNIKLFQSDDKNIKPKSKNFKHKIIPRLLFFKRYMLDKDLNQLLELNLDEPYFLTRDLIDTEHIITYNHDWLTNEIKNNLNYYNPKKFINKVLNRAILDEKLLLLLKTEFFYFSNAETYLIPHSIVLTNGKTGKTSILGRIGETLDNLTDAGLFGYYDVKTNIWYAGKVSTSKSAILIDEINEIIKKKNKLFETLNRPLENGEYLSGKAGSINIKVNNQFILMGNISETFNFEQFVFNLSNNIITAGRRFGYIIYDDKVKFKNGKLREYNQQLITEIRTFSNIISHLFLVKFKEFKLYKYFSEPKKKDKVIKIIQDQLKEIDNQLNQLLEIEAMNTYIFIKEFKEALTTRTLYMAFMITFFDNFKQIMISKLNRRDFIEIAYKNYKKLIDINLQSIKKIIEHLKNNEIKPVINIIDYKNLSEINKMLLYYLYLRKQDLLTKKYIVFSDYNLYSNNKKVNRRLKDLKDKLKKRPCLNQKSLLESIGLSYSIGTNKEVKILLLNIFLFNNFMEFYEQHNYYSEYEQYKNKTDTDIIIENIDYEDL